MNDMLQKFGEMMNENLWLAPLFALLAGLITSFTPCCLANISLIIGYVSGTGSKDTKKAFLLSLLFALGSATTFAILGLIAAVLGKMIEFHTHWWDIFLGILMLFMALQIFGLYNFIPSTNLISKSTKRGYIGAYLAGILGGFFSSPCATPVLVVLLAVVADQRNLIGGIVLLLLYSFGHSILTIIAGTSVGFVSKLTSSNRYGTFSKYLKIIMGITVLVLSIYMFYLGIFHVHE